MAEKVQEADIATYKELERMQCELNDEITAPMDNIRVITCIEARLLEC